MACPLVRYLVVVGAFSLAAPGVTHAQNAVSAHPPRQVPDSVQAQMDAMMPMMGKMMTAMMRSTLALLTEPETAQQMATFTKNYFDALLTKGFTREEALRIVMAVGVPMGPGGQR